MDMNMNMGGSNPDWYWIFWWVFTLLVYAVIIIWWRVEIKQVDRKNAEKFEWLKQYREEKLITSDHDD